MLRRFHLMLAAFAFLFAPLAMQSGVAMAAMPMDRGEAAQAGHCGSEDDGGDEQTGAMMQCCVAMCAAVAPLGAPSIEPLAYQAPMLAAFHPAAHRLFLAELPTPPPRAA